jgi:hypothetical protein
MEGEYGTLAVSGLRSDAGTGEAGADPEKALTLEMALPDARPNIM